MIVRNCSVHPIHQVHLVIFFPTSSSVILVRCYFIHTFITHNNYKESKGGNSVCNSACHSSPGTCTPSEREIENVVGFFPPLFHSTNCDATI